MWETHNMGSESIYGSLIIHELMWLFSRCLGLGIELVQILLQVFFLLGAAFSMFYLSKTVYPKLQLSSLISAAFYTFNFFVLQSRLNIGMAWTYMFLPLLMALLIKITEEISQGNSEVANKKIVYFAITSAITLSFASINVANIISILVVLAIILLYQLVIHRKRIRQLLLNILKLTAISLLLNLWWTIPIVNYYFWSSSALNPEISVTAWSWTHSRASFINLLWLNGGWGWLPEYVPYITSYSNPILIILVFFPFLLAASALLFKSKISPFNAYLMLFTLVLLFLAKGLHEPLSQLNLLFYNHIPFMVMFREPTSKFTMALVPFLALLIGYAVDRIANTEIKVKPSKLTKTLTASFFIITFIIAAYPLVTNPIETKTQQLPFSSYVEIPDYWDQATNWLNRQPSDFKILVTPPDDFYQMPYTWGYYGTDQFLTRLVQKPILSNFYTFSYKTNPNIVLTLKQLYNTIKYNRTVEFKAFLDLLNLKYILQRNDIQYNFTGRNIIPPENIQAFLTQQPYIHLDQKFGQLDIYEYDEPKPYLYILSPTTLKQITVKIENITTLEHSWNFTSLTDVQEWQNATQPSQWQIKYTITQDDNTLKAELWNSTWGWKTINSPLLPAKYGNTYQIQTDIKGQNAHQVHTKVAEYDANKNILTANYLAFVNDETFNWTHVIFNFDATNEATKYLQIQIWHGHETDKQFPNKIWIDNFKIHGYTIRLNTTGLNLIFQNTTQNQPATILDYTKRNPTKITATINATQPFILAISEALDQSWKAYVNGKQIENTPLYLGLKGFHINQT
ncbi:MAG: YfhO family protein, partial [Candidatus Bathyarchaeota archaeon]|nr:YfhO family protein [Candidatus Bathyarchaeota archaeon]